VSTGHVRPDYSCAASEAKRELIGCREYPYVWGRASLSEPAETQYKTALDNGIIPCAPEAHQIDNETHVSRGINYIGDVMAIALALELNGTVISRKVKLTAQFDA
jgi:hypothetical protein